MASSSRPFGGFGTRPDSTTTNTTSPNPFVSAASSDSTNTTTAPFSLFGSATRPNSTNTTTNSPSLFGGLATTSNSTNTTTTSPSLFGSTARSSSTNTTTNSPNLFGSTARSSSTVRSDPKPLFASVGGFSSKSVLSPQVSTEEIHSRLLVRSVAGLFNDAKYSDATIRIYDVTLPVHRSIICTQSPYFEKAFKENMKEGIERELKFKEGSGPAHWRVFEYLYTGNYSEELPTDGFPDDQNLLKDALVYALADMFFLDNLQAISKRKFENKLKNDWNNYLFPDCVRGVYEDAPSLRSLVVEVAVAHAHELSKKEVFTELLKEGGDFAVEYTDALLKKVNIK